MGKRAGENSKERLARLAKQSRYFFKNGEDSCRKMFGSEVH